MSDEQYAGFMRWFETLSVSIEKMRSDYNGLDKRIAALQDEVHEVRELLVHLQNDDRVQRHAIADVSRRVETLESRP